MSYTTNIGGYVKFIRGTTALWNQIPAADKSSDVLYFITDVGSATGKLYLGEKLISNGDLSSATSMADLNDVLIGEGITDQSLLVYDATDKVWKNVSILDIFQQINTVFQGATAEADGSAGLVPAPTAGQENLFLRGDATWVNPVADVESTLNTLIGTDVNLSIREIASDEAATQVATIIANAPEEFDTLKEIADWIANNPGSGDVADLVTKVDNLDKVVNGTIPEGGTEATGGLVQITSDLTTRVEALETSMDTVETDITEIKESIRWQDIASVETV